MKKLAVIIMLIGSQAYGQMDITQMSGKSVCWLGLDFTMAKMIGSQGFKEPDRVHAEFLPGWNKFFYTEPKKYSIKDAFHLDKKAEVKLRTAATENRNGEIPSKGFIQEKRYFVTESMVTDQVKTFDFSEAKEDVGVLFMVESFSKNEELATIWVVLIDLKQKDVFFIREMTGKPLGAGILNHWAGAVFHILNDIEEVYYDAWTQDVESKKKKKNKG